MRPRLCRFIRCAVAQARCARKWALVQASATYGFFGATAAVFFRARAAVQKFQLASPRPS